MSYLFKQKLFWNWYTCDIFITASYC